MNYKESSKILQEIKQAKRILINCHRGPDPDSIGSAMALRRVLEGLGKEVLVVCPSPMVSESMFIDGADKIVRIDFSKFNFSKFDLFLVVDSSTWAMVSGSEEVKIPDIPLLVIDHHFSNKGFGKINLIDHKTSSAAEVLFNVFKDWKIKIDKIVAQSLLTGIISDTGTFQYPGVGKATLKTAGDLIGKGANKDEIIKNLIRNTDFREIKLWGKFIENMILEEKYNFVWSAIPFSIFKEFGEITYAKDDAANLLFPIVRDTNFGVVMVETKEGLLSVSFRSRDNFDVSQIASELGGGGHKLAAGVRIENLPFDKAVEKVLEVSRKYAKKTS